MDSRRTWIVPEAQNAFEGINAVARWSVRILRHGHNTLPLFRHRAYYTALSGLGFVGSYTFAIRSKVVRGLQTESISAVNGGNGKHGQ